MSKKSLIASFSLPKCTYIHGQVHQAMKKILSWGKKKLVEHFQFGLVLISMKLSLEAGSFAANAA